MNITVARYNSVRVSSAMALLSLQLERDKTYFGTPDTVVYHQDRIDTNFGEV
jgi:hypothetical protein